MNKDILCNNNKDENVHRFAYRERDREEEVMTGERETKRDKKHDRKNVIPKVKQKV